MTQTFQTDSNNDIFTGSDGNLAIATGMNAVLHACATAAKAQLGEMVLATGSGVPNFQTIWNGVPNIRQFDAALRNVLLAVDGVTGVASLDISASSNALTYSAVIQTAYGNGVING